MNSTRERAINKIYKGTISETAFILSTAFYKDLEPRGRIPHKDTPRAYLLSMGKKSFWVERDGQVYCPFCPSRARSWNPPYNETLTLIIDEEVELTPEDWTMTGLDQLKTICPECNIFLYDPNEEED